MYYTAREWLAIFANQDPLTGMVLVIAGLSFLLLGFRMSNLVVALDSLVLALVAGARVCDGFWTGYAAGVVVGAGLAGLAWLHPRKAMVLLASLTGAYICGGFVAHLEGNPPPVLIAGVLGFGCFLALGFVVFDQMVVIITAIQGAALLMAGAAILISASPSWAGGFHVLASRYGFFLPMLIFGSSLIGVFFQLAEIQAERSGNVKV
jgi:hypothetical protein